MIIIVQLLCLCIVYVFANQGVIFKGHVGSKPGWAFHGKLFKNSPIVHISPKFKALPVLGISKSVSICGYTVHYDTMSYFPFDVLVTDQSSGDGEIKLKSNIERDILKSSYTFQIEAYDCDTIPHYSERKFVLVEVKTEQRPIFFAPSYHFSAKVSTAVGTKIGFVSAFERPELISVDSNARGICKYSIKATTPVPFTIDAFGSVRTKVLVLGNVQSVRYRFDVEAIDCRQPHAVRSSVPVTVDIFDDCEPHWKDLPSSAEYHQNNKVLPLVLAGAVAPSLHLCTRSCQDMLLRIDVRLRGKDLRPATTSLCRHDQESLGRHEKTCDLSKNGVDVLAMASGDFKGDKGGEGVFFNGSRALTLDTNLNKFGHGVMRQFTVLFWMKHAQMENEGPKEQILCNSDGQDHNRHHFSLFLHNCKLILLFRKEFNEAYNGASTPSEWRFGPLKEVCDDKWHHFALLFNDGSVDFLIDGEIAKKSPQQLNDKPMFQSPAGRRGTKFTAGACYHAKAGAFVQYIKGSLASLRILDGVLESLNNIRCMATCGESLLMPDVQGMLGSHTSVTLLSDSVVMKSSDVFNLLKIFSKLSYINTDGLEDLRIRGVAHRIVTIAAEISCDGNHVSKIPPAEVVINLKYEAPPAVNKAPLRPLIEISSHVSIRGFEGDRIQLFRGLEFIAHKGAPRHLQSCIVRPVGIAIQQWEYIDWPINIIIDLHLTGLNNSHGLVLDGQQSLGNYEKILAKIYYVTTKYDASETVRKFAVSCSMVDKSVTDEVIVGVEMKQRDLKTYYVVDEPSAEQDKASDGDMTQHGQGGGMIIQEKTASGAKESKKRAPPTTAVWIVLSCLLVVLVSAAVGMALFYRKLKNRPRKFLGDFHWQRRDKMTVIPNPLVTEGVGLGEVEVADDDSMVNDVPESMDDLDEDEIEDMGEGEGEGCKDRITIPRFLRLPGVVHGASVDV